VPVDVLDELLDTAGVLVAAPLTDAPNTVAPIAPPASIDPTIAAAAAPLRQDFICYHLLLRL
jgi:hypothetical protein